ncbi:hypothetical protein MtrunA17_Chr2g0276791 [Medicago truncatula]|uniref:Uncharacterized protein n=1 Tax=Medicago truncatula TaxID=3880 RepID=A0A396J0U2_MEDTR|nr:hypothetical protein MtrunA17_Chr2g0276791 [Medicago truncatula]
MRECVISGGNPHLTSRFCEDELGLKFQHGIRVCQIQGPPTYSRTKLRFCGVVLGPTTISKMVSEPFQDPLGHLLSGFRYRATHESSPIVLVVRECVISGGNPHLTSRFCEDELCPKFQHGIGVFRIQGPPTYSRTKPRFCGVVLGPTTIFKMVSEPLQDPLGHLLSAFRYRATHQLCPRIKPNSAGRGVC